ALVSVTGDGYGTSETVTLEFGVGAGKLTKQGTADCLGTFSLTFTVNTQAYGTKTIVVTGTATDTHKAENYDFKILPNIIEVTPSQGTVGQIITVKGNGYINEQVKIGFGTNATILNNWVTNLSGTFSFNFTVDTQPYGTASVTATGAIAGMATSTFFIKTSIFSISPSEGTVGSLLVINGNGFEAGGTLSVLFGVPLLINPGTATTAGSFERVFTLDEQPGGTVTVTASTSEQVQADKAFYIKANIHTVSPSNGSVGTSVIIVGNGYKASDMISVKFGTTPDRGTASASGVADINNGLGGTFTLTFTINSQPCGSTTITATGQTLNTASNIFYIKATIYSLTPTSGTVGTLVNISGSGYKAVEPINISFGSHPNITTGVGGGTDGRFTASFVVDTQAYGSTTITAMDADELSIVGYERFIIRPAIYATTPTIGTVGMSVTINGNGFGANEGILVGFGTTVTITEVSTDASGEFEAIFTIDNQSIGSNTITAQGTTTGTSAVSYFKVEPRLTLITPTSGSVGTIVSLEGDGYQANELVRIKFGNNNTITTTAALSNGRISTNFTIDTQIYGTTAVTAIGSISSGTAEINFHITPNIHTVSPNTGTVGMTVIVAGDGFKFMGSPIVVDLGNTSGQANVEASDNGSFSTTFIVNTQVFGTKTVHAYWAGNTDVFADNSFKIIPAIHTVSPSTGTVGLIITVAGNGYGQYEYVEIGFGTTPSIAKPMSTDIGQFSISFTVDTQVYGTCAVVGTGTTNSCVATSTFFCLPHIVSVMPASATVGKQITISGDGYIGGIDVNLAFGAYQTTAVGTASLSGTFSTIFTLNEQAGGSLTITAYSTGAVHQSTAPFYIKANIHTVTPETGTVGTWVQLTGNGYRALGTITVGFGTTPAVVVTQASNIVNGEGGTFTAGFTINTQPYGTCTITAAGLINSVTRLFTILPNIFRVSPDTGTVGTRVTVAGNGYPTGAISLNFGTKTAIVTG
ncbi:MAG: hypothetical protein AAB296_09195, partial [Candidatus Desantisbacteria bacterium]